MSKKHIYVIIAIPLVIITFSTAYSSSSSPLITGIAGFGALIMLYLISYENSKERRQRIIQEEKRRQERIKQLNEIKIQEELKEKHKREKEEMERKRQAQAKIEQLRTTEPWCCAHCGSLNPGKGIFCQMCGKRKQ